MSQHHHHSKNSTHGGVGLYHYEFSCSNSPNPVAFHMTKRKHHFLSIPHFPCINPPNYYEEPTEPNEIVAFPRIEYSPEYSYSFRFSTPDFALGEKSSLVKSPFSVRVSNYSSVEQESDGTNMQVDSEAEEFI
ncbi:hypothetical protein IFM89_030431 [Coptis chinensis]|uniref:Uncharacterized protein n=1 Tax=Coptis chinensis TaxID=261450 RepID=A0A835LVY8_9MAGN|nr:hypothetical protein IFM89_030431 [Coptis chinensis]